MTIAPYAPVPRTVVETEFMETDLTRGIKELWAAIPEYERAECYYEGEVEEVFATPRIERYLARSRNRYRLNFIKTAVNAIADRIEVASVNVPGARELNELISKIRKKNRMTRKERTIHRRVPLYGDAYLFAWPANPDDPNIKFEVHYNNPKTTRAIYDHELPDKVKFVIKMWREPSPLGIMTWRANLYYLDQIEKYIQKTEGRDSPTSNTANTVYPDAPHGSLYRTEAPSFNPDDWELMEEPTPNPYNMIPIFHFRNDEPYGKPRHKDAYGAQDAINKLSTTLVHTADFQGFPQRYGLAEENATIGGSGDDEDWADDEDRTRGSSGTAETGIESGPGTFIRLEGIKAAGSFPAASPDAFMDPAKFYLRSMAQITTTPVRFFDPLGEPPSGEALRAMDAPLNKEVLDLEDMLEETWAEFYEFVLKVLSGRVPRDTANETDPDDPDDEIQVDVQWKPVFSIDDAVGWEMVQTKIAAGVPTRQALMEAGYSQRQVDEWLASNENRTVLDRDTEIMVQIAAAARDFATAVHEGILDAEVVQHVLTGHLNRLIKEELPEPKPKEPLVVNDPGTTPPPPEQEGEETDGQRPEPPPSPSENGRSASAEAARRLAKVPDRER